MMKLTKKMVMMGSAVLIIAAAVAPAMAQGGRNSRGGRMPDAACGSVYAAQQAADTSGAQSFDRGGHFGGGALRRNGVQGLGGRMNQGGRHGFGGSELAELHDKGILSDETYQKIGQSRYMARYDSFLEQGVITQEEYDAVKTYLDAKYAEKNTSQREAMLSRMVDMGLITREQADALLAENAAVADEAPVESQTEPQA